MLRSMKLQDLNSHILCVLCGGYLVDATTIVECLHSFCRSCIVKYLHNSFHCPVCDVEVHKTKPLLHIRPDRTLQEIVYKLVPGLYQGEVKLRENFEEKQRQENISEEEISTEHETKNKQHIGMKDPVCITLEYYRRKRNWMEKQIFPTRYLRCPSAMTVTVLKKFLIMKFAIPSTHQVEIIRCDEILHGHLTMTEVSRIYGLYAKSFLDLEYAILEVGVDETTTVENKNIYKFSHGKIHPRKKKKRKREANCAETKIQQSTTAESFQPPRKIASLAECCNSAVPMLQSDILPTFPDTPPSFDLIPDAKPIEYRA